MTSAREIDVRLMASADGSVRGAILLSHLLVTAAGLAGFSVASQGGRRRAFAWIATALGALGVVFFVLGLGHVQVPSAAFMMNPQFLGMLVLPAVLTGIAADRRIGAESVVDAFATAGLIGAVVAERA